jgi:hypothetical protein
MLWGGWKDLVCLCGGTNDLALLPQFPPVGDTVTHTVAYSSSPMS